MKTFSRKISRKFKRLQAPLANSVQNLLFARSYRHLRDEKKIIYALTPPPYLKNVGDHAQVIAIRAWIEKHFPGFPVIEVDKDQGHICLSAIQRLVQPDDLIFLHSGGNLGDRGKWSERMRREMISTFPGNQIVSLPQTIHFSDTPAGIEQKEKTRCIYSAHPNLTVIGRDPRSGEIATELFPNANTFCMPDFVLSLPARSSETKNSHPKVLLCLRLDSESALTLEQHKEIGDSISYDCTYYDTTLPKSIDYKKRKSVLDETLELFLSADVVVTDRYHGLIFTILCQKPCVVLRTVDHKLTSAIHWFKDMPQIKFAHSLDEVSGLVDECLKIENRESPDWSANFFDKIPELIGAQQNIKSARMKPDKSFTS